MRDSYTDDAIAAVTLPDGEVLQQPLTTTELYGTFANAWRVTQATSLFDYGPGRSTATFTDSIRAPSDLLAARFSMPMT
jgi:hypothetical protein